MAKLGNTLFFFYYKLFLDIRFIYIKANKLKNRRKKVN